MEGKLFFQLGLISWILAGANADTSETLTCADASCVKEDKPRRPGICTVSGENYYISFDNKMFSFAGAYEMVMLEYPGVRLDVGNILCEYSSSTCGIYLRLVVGDVPITATRGADLEVKGHPFPGNVHRSKDGSIDINQVGGTTTVIRAKSYGLKVYYNGVTTVTVQLDESYRTKTRGLCGNFDGDRENDFTLQDGTLSWSTIEFVNSWRATSETRELISADIECEPSNPRLAWAMTKCSVIHDANGVFRLCIAHLSPSIRDKYYRQCVASACRCDKGGDFECLCEAVYAFATACSNQGKAVKWRSNNLCPLQCDNGMVYKACGSECEVTCDNFRSDPEASCSDSCVEGCFCIDGLIRKEDKCVEPKECLSVHTCDKINPESVASTECGA